jgi:hypothetical protein
LRLCQCCQLMCGVVFIFTNGGCNLTQWECIYDPVESEFAVMENAINVGSQAEESDMECSDNDNDCLDDYDYYNIVDDNDIEQIDPSKIDPENFIYDCLGEEQVERLLNETVEYLSSSLKITPSLAKVSVVMFLNWM